MSHYDSYLKEGIHIKTTKFDASMAPLLKQQLCMLLLANVMPSPDISLGDQKLSAYVGQGT